ncbi:MAG: type IV pilus assembly protein [Gallionellaceae bacterium]|nr:MAG: type IV pilus assembly protein [Gallionellaceae bacterium]
MNTIRILMTCAFVAMLGNSIRGQAEDIDLYSSAASVTGTDLPNVLFIMDNAANFNASAAACTYADTGLAPSLGNTTGGIEQCALVNAINSLPLDTVNIGIMAYNKTGMDTLYGCQAGGTGGCLVKALTRMNAAGKAAIIANIKAWTSGTIQSNNEATAQAMQEAWAYYAGKQGMSGRTYTSTALSGCQKNYVIYIGNAFNNSGSPGDASASPGARLATTITNNTALSTAQRTLLGAAIQIPSGAYGTSAFTCSPNPYTLNLSNGHGETTGLYADEWARYMHATDLSTGAMPATKKIFTYTIGVLDTACKADYPALLTSMALNGGGKYFPTGNAADIQQAILRVLNEVQAVNSVFSSASLPVSVNTQGTYLNQIFMGMFRPDSGGVPRWKGNLKQYQFVYDPTAKQLSLADATGAAAISAAGTGFLSPNAASFWTCTNAANTQNRVTPYNVAPYSNTSICSNSTPYTDPAVGFWANDKNGQGLAWDLPDGEVVEKGGAAQILRLANLNNTYTAVPGTSTNPRNLYTYLGANAALSNAVNVFDTSNATITDAMLGTGPLTISSINSASTVQANSFTPSAAGTAATITITNFAKGSGSTVTATVASTAALVAGTTQFTVATGSTKYDCTACTVATIVDATQFTYIASPGTQTAPATPYVAAILSNFVTVSSTAHGLAVGQTMTVSACATHTTLNATDATVSSVTNTNTFVISTAVTLGSTAVDASCRYSLKTATVTTAAAHGLPTGALVAIAGAAPAGYNGSWVIKAVGTTTFTYQYTAAAPLANFAGAGATATSSITTRDMLTRWVRGEDNLGDEASLCPPGSTAGVGNCPNPAVNIRPSVHGDVLHSRPVVLNYGGGAIAITAIADSGTTRTATASAADVAKIGATNAQANVTFDNGLSCKVTVASTTTFTYPTTGCGTATAPQSAATSAPNVIVFYGGNDGVFRSVNGNQVNPISSPFTLPTPGGELWGFIPDEFFGQLKRQHDNSPALLMPSTPAGIIPTPQKKDYFVDGSTGVYQVIDGTGKTTKAYLYLAMRRGGRLIYALDVTDPTNPKFLWKHSNADAGFSELGQTWSQPKVATVAGYANPVLIFGAGYDAAAEDVEPPTADTMGRGIFILDAVTGSVVWKATYGAALSCPSASAACTLPEMKYSVPSDITLLDRNNDGKIDRLYVGDVGGNMWRVDLEPTGAHKTPVFWQVEKLAALGCTTGVCAAGVAPRKIFYPPEVIITSGYDAVFTATGDREHPLYSTTGITITATVNSGSTRTATASAADVAKIGAVGATKATTFDNKQTCTVTVASATTFTYPASGCGDAGAQSAKVVITQSACTVTNRAYLLKDTATGTDGSGLTTLTESNLFNATATLWDGTLSGYYVTFNFCEKSVNAPLVVAGYIYFGTNQAKAQEKDVCEESLGEAVGYKLAPFTGKYAEGEFEGGGLPPSPVAGVVNIVDAAGKTIQVAFCIGCGGEDDNGGNTGCGSESALAGCKPPIEVTSSRSRTYWYIKGK